MITTLMCPKCFFAYTRPIEDDGIPCPSCGADEEEISEILAWYMSDKVGNYVSD